MDAARFGQEVFKRRKSLKLSQGELAHRAGISRNYISLIERGEAQNVSINIINQLAEVLQASPAELLGEAPRPQTLVPPALREFALRSGLSFEIVDRLARIPRRGQEPQTPDEWEQLFEAIRPYLE